MSTIRRNEPDLFLLLATLCDGMKRLERAIVCESLEDRRDYLDEAAKRRRYVEDKILNIKPQNKKDPPHQSED